MPVGRFRRAWPQPLAAEEKRCRQYAHGAGVLIIDLDTLKPVNDQEGHAAGDRLLRRAAAAIRDTCRSSDVVARLGGGGFGVVAVEVRPQDLDALATRIDDALRAVGSPMRDSKLSLDTAVSDADALMYAAKRRRKMARPKAGRS